MTVHLLEEMSTPALDALDRARTLVLLTVSPLEQHGPHLPLGVDAFAARHFAETLAERLVATRPGWTAVLAPTLHLGSFTFDSVGTIRIRQRVVRDAVVDYGASLARAGFRWIAVANGHGGPGHLVALEEAAAIVSRRHHVTMASLTGYLAWEFLRGRYLPRIEERLGRPLSDEERAAFADDMHGGLWETSFMLWRRPDLVADSFRSLPAARYSLPAPPRAQLPPAQWRPGLCRPPRAGRSRLRAGDDGGAPRRGHAPGRRPPRRGHHAGSAPLAVLGDALPAHELLARAGRGGGGGDARRVVGEPPRTERRLVMKAYVLIETAAGKTKNVKKTLTKVKSAKATVVAMDAVTGPYDFIVVVDGASLDAIGNLVTESIGAIDGVTRTTTCVAVAIG